MKKRLLSAALALAMVLTMLPLSVMPAFATTAEGADVYYHVKNSDFSNQAATDVTTTPASSESGWYLRTAETDSNGKTTGKYTYAPITDDGWVNSVSTSNGATSKWYSKMGEAVTVDNKSQTFKPSSFTLTGDLTIASLDWTISNGRLNGHTLTVTALATTTGTSNSRVSSYSITVYGKDAKDTASALVLPDTAIEGRTLNLTATDVAVSASNSNRITVKNEMDGTDEKWKVKNYGGGTIKITNGSVGNITMPKGSITLTNVNAGAADIVMGTSASGQGGTITLDKGSHTTGSVLLYGPSTLNVYDTSSAGTVTVFGGDKANVQSNADKTPDKQVNPNWSGVKINLTTSGTVDVIKHAGSGMGLDGEAQGTVDLTTHTVDGKTNGKVGNGGITLNYANVTFDGAGVAGATAVSVGSVKLSNNATAGAITLGDSTKTFKGKCTLDISGAGTTVTGDVKTSDVAATDLTVKISNGKFTSTTAIDLGDGYKGGGITGGTFGASITKTAWMSNVTYEIAKDSKDFTYTNSLAEAVSAYTDDPNKNVVSIAGTKSGVEVLFLLDDKSDPVFVLKAAPSTLVTLPTTLGNRSVTTWYKGNVPYTAGTDFQVQSADATDGKIKLNAISTDADLGTINGVTAEVHGTGIKSPNLTAELVGNTIKLSGAVDMGTNNYANLKLHFTTTTNKTGLDYGATYHADKKVVLFANLSSAFQHSTDLVVSNGDKEIALKGSNTRYTVDCSGLRKLENVTVAGAATEQVVTISGTNLGATEKDNLIEKLKTSTLYYTDSNAMLQAINKALASYTASGIESAITRGRQAYARDKYGNTNSDTMKNSDVLAYDELKIQVYLDIRVTGITRSGAATSGSLTLDITPKYHEVVFDGTNYFVNPTAYNLDSSLLKSTDGMVAIRIKYPASNPAIFKSDDSLWVHHGDYVYKQGTGEGCQFINLHGFSSFTINTTGPVASADYIVRNGEETGTKGTQAYYYDSLVQAVADVADGGIVTVKSGYSGTTSIPVSGGARQFTVNNKANAGTALTFTGANVTSDGKNDTYTVELKQDNFVNTTISVSSNSNGTTTVSTNSARPGATVTITATPKSGYQASTPTVTTNTGASVTVSGSNGTYTFVVPAGATSITVRPNYVLSTGMPFTDVTNTSAWYFNGVKYCWDTMKNGYHLMQGYSDDEFGPSRNFTRAEMVQILYNINGRPSVTGLSNPFSDVNRTNAQIAWAYDAIVWAANNGYADGDGDGRFRPSSNVSRCELVEFLWKYENKPTGSGNLNAYSDGSSVPQWAQASMRWAVGFNILSGQNSVSLGNSIAAESNALRSQVAVTMMQYYERYGG